MASYSNIHGMFLIDTISIMLKFNYQITIVITTATFHQ